MPLGVHAINPFNGERLEVWVANFVLMGYGTGAVMSVPGHDERDHEFAREFKLPNPPGDRPRRRHGGGHPGKRRGPTRENAVVVNSGEYSGLSFRECFDRMADWLEATGRGARRINYRLHDWGVSRQRYWGCPVPVVHCDACGMVPVPDDMLPVVLPEDVDIEGGGSPLARLPEFVETTCPTCGADARRDTDTFDTFMESSWYFARFACADADTAKLDERADYWMPVDQYIGGIEHAILHLMYARFYQKLMNEAGLAKAREPFASLLTQGMVVAPTFFREDDGAVRYHAPAEVEIEHDARGGITGAHLLADGLPVEVGPIEKMAKSKNNGVDPERMIARYGADTVRLYIIETSPPDQMLEWSDRAVEGASKFLRRLWRIVREHVEQGPAPALDVKLLDGPGRELRCRTHETIAKVSDDVGRRYKFNTACAACRELVNDVMAFDANSDVRRSVVREALESVVLMLAPVVPHVCHTLWQALGHRDPVIDAAWPAADEAAMSRDVIELVVQVNGKLRGHVSVDAGADREAVGSARRSATTTSPASSARSRSGRSSWCPDGSSTSSYDGRRRRPPRPGAGRRGREFSKLRPGGRRAANGDADDRHTQHRSEPGPGARARARRRMRLPAPRKRLAPAGARRGARHRPRRHQRRGRPAPRRGGRARRAGARLGQHRAAPRRGTARPPRPVRQPGHGEGERVRDRLRRDVPGDRRGRRGARAGADGVSGARLRVRRRRGAGKEPGAGRAPGRDAPRRGGADRRPHRRFARTVTPSRPARAPAAERRA